MVAIYIAINQSSLVTRQGKKKPVSWSGVSRLHAGTEEASALKVSRDEYKT